MNQENALELLAETEVLIRKRDYNQALETAQLVLKVATDNNMYAVRGKASSMIGSIYSELHDLQSALKFFQESLESFEHIDAKIDIAKNLSNISIVYSRQSDNQRALEYCLKALSINQELDFKEGIARSLGNLGLINDNISNYPEALENYLRAFAIFEELGKTEEAVKNLNNVGNVYKDISDYSRALYFHHKAMALNEKLGIKQGIAVNLSNIGIVYKELADFPNALQCYFKALEINTELSNRNSMANNLGNIGIVYSMQGDYTTALEYFNKALSIFKEIGNRLGIASNLGNIGNLYLEQSDFSSALKYFEETLANFEELGVTIGIVISLLGLGTLFANNKFEGYNFFKAEQFLLRGIEMAESIGAKKNLYDMHRVLSDLYKQEGKWKESRESFEKFYQIERDVQNEESKKQALNLAYERQTAEKEKLIEVERARALATDKILANILPANITERLIKGDKKIADTYHNVSVLFTDIVGFTNITSRLPATELIDLLDIVFTRFDTICKKYGLEKIKTIGDAYMAVCGAPVLYENHAERTAFAALEMMEDFSIEKRFSIPIDIGFRIGLHSGSVVAGIIGENKYSYDLWGDAVNTASRMESYGEEDKIHVSEEFRNSAGDGFTFLERGEIDIKGKGKMKTYFLEKITL